MNIKNRTTNSFFNALTSILVQILTIVLGFATRTVFIYTLGEEYLGINGLFSNILQVLSIADLGLESAIVFSLYKPLAENNENKINVIMSLYKKAYSVIGTVIFAVGLALIPALPYIMKGTTNVVNVNVIYVLFLLNTVSSYWFFAYRRSILVADQKTYLYQKITFWIRIISVSSQILVLVLFKNFYFYTIVGILTNVLSNILISNKSLKEFPFLKKKTKEKLPRNELLDIEKNIFGSSLYKICGVVTNSTSNILISAFIGVKTVGIYSNYLLITNYMQQFFQLAFNSFTASIGNLFVKESNDKKEFIFRCLNFLNFWVYGLGGILLFVCVNPFIELWIGEKYLLSTIQVFAIYANVVIVGLQQSVKAHRSACGLFWKGKYRPVATVVVNLLVSFTLAPKFGLIGILLGAIIAHIATIFWFDPVLLYKDVFKKSPLPYFIKYIFNFILISVLSLGLFYLFSSWSVSWLTLIARAAICFVVANGVFFLIYGKSEEFKYIKQAALQLIFSKIKRKNNKT